MSLPEPLVPLATAWRDAVRTPRRRALLAAGTLLVALAMLVARGGTWQARASAAGAMAVGAAAAAYFARRERRVWGDPHRAIDRLAGSIDPPRAARAQRALGLIDPTRTHDDGTSRELAELHARRALAALPSDAIERGASRLALRFATAALGLALAVLAIAIAAPWSVLEGLDVLVARRHVAPVPMTWLDEPDLYARPPDYLHESERAEPTYGHVALPRGTLLTYRGTPLHAGRRLALSDGENEVPFVDDGQGHVVARWPLTDSVGLKVVARFGDVAIEEGEGTHVRSIDDLAPIVKLEGAPKKIELASSEDLGEIQVRYEAHDDHGLREVHLVLRAGTREERRVLARLDGATRVDKGGHVLRASDPFVKKSHVPVEVRVEAKDNDPITGPKWGASEAITIVPPDVGEPQALRLEALKKLRDRFVDSLAWRMANAIPKDGKERAAMLADEGKSVDEDAELLDATVTGTYAGVRVPGRLLALLRGQMRKVREAMSKEATVASPQTHGALVKASERITLVIDAIVRGLGDRDTRAAAKQLADVADDVALGETQEASVDDRDRGRARVEAAMSVLEGGEKSMLRLGDLGRDLGEIVQNDLSRIARGRTGSDWPHAELAARDLAARLRDPDPSFARGGKPSRGGGESGGAHGTPGEEAEEGGDEVAQAFNEAAQDLENLAQEHAGEMAKVENALSGAAKADDVKQMADDAKSHAEKVRESVRELPSVGAGSESWSGKSATAREHAEQMARALEQGSPADAVSSGRNALQALDEAKRAAQNDPWRRFNSQESEAEKQVDQARKKLEPEIAWAQQKLVELRKRAAERAQGELSADGHEEAQLAERARQLGEKGRDQMPAGALDALEEAEKAMQRAADALRAGDPDKAMDQQRDAQRQLEMAKQAMGSQGDEGGDPGDAPPNDDSSSRPANGEATIPNADAHKGPEDFRRRVTEGLSQPSSGRLRDAVRRYAEGLLR